MEKVRSKFSPNFATEKSESPILDARKLRTEVRLSRRREHFLPPPDGKRFRESKNFGADRAHEDPQDRSRGQRQRQQRQRRRRRRHGRQGRIQKYILSLIFILIFSLIVVKFQTIKTVDSSKIRTR